MHTICNKLSPDGANCRRKRVSPAYNKLAGQTRVRTAIQMRVLVLSVAAVIVCAATLGVLQFRSLAQLEIRTRTTFQDDLVRASHAIAGGVQDDVRTVGASVLASFDKDDSKQDVRDLARRFQEIRQGRPEIDELFLFALDDPDGTSAVFSTRDGAERFT